MGNKKPSSSARGYDHHWKALRIAQLRAEPLCAYCKKSGRDTLATVVDHIVSFKTRPELRLDRTNLQSLCKVCHDNVKRREENSGGTVGCDEDGFPLCTKV